MIEEPGCRFRPYESERRSKYQYTTEIELPDVPDSEIVTPLLEDGHWNGTVRVSAAEVMFEDELGRCRFIQTWAPTWIIPAHVLANFVRVDPIMQWVYENREITCAYVTEQVSMAKPGVPEGGLFGLRPDDLVFCIERKAYDAKNRAILLQLERLTSDKTLSYRIPVAEIPR